MYGDRGIYRWTGPGAPILNKQGNLQNAEFYTITADPTNRNIVYGIAQDQITALKYTGGAAWNYLSDGDEVGKILVSPLNSNRLWAFDPLNSNSKGFVRRSEDGGVTWVAKGNGIPTTLAGYNYAYTSQKAFTMDPSNPHRLLLGTTKLYITTDDGDSWSAPNANDLSNGSLITAIAVAPSHANTIYAGTADGKFWVTTDGGVTWTEKDTGLSSFPPVADIEIDPNDPNHLYIAQGYFAGNDNIPSSVSTTTNGGTTWNNVTGDIPANIQTLALAVDWRWKVPILYAGTGRDRTPRRTAERTGRSLPVVCPTQSLLMSSCCRSSTCSWPPRTAVAPSRLSALSRRRITA